jgi:nicotinamidase-related amidase
VVPNREGDLPVDGVQQIVIEKQTVDVFQAANLARVLDRLGAERCVVYGVVTEICVAYAARGLLQRGKQVAIVTEAIEKLDARRSEETLSELRSAGALLCGVGDV